MIHKYFKVVQLRTSISAEIKAGIATFFTLSYILLVQPSILSGMNSGTPTGMDFGALLTGTCIASAIGCFLMALWARLPIAQAPGMGENFFFTNSILPGAVTLAATHAWQVALGVVFFAGLLFFLLTLFGITTRILKAFSHSMREAVVGGVGLFITLIGFENAGLIVKSDGFQINPEMASSPGVLVFFFGLFLGVVFQVKKIKSSVLWSILSSLLLTVILHFFLPSRVQFEFPAQGISLPPSLSPIFMKVDFIHAFSWEVIPLILVLLVLTVFDATGSLVAFAHAAGMKEEVLSRTRQALMSNSVAAMIGSFLGMSTVITYTESLAGIEQGGRTGLTSLTVGFLFLISLFLFPIVEMVANYPPITAPALVLVGALMLKRIKGIEWLDYTEMIPSFLIIICIPFFFSFADGIGIGLVAYPLIKLATGRFKDLNIFNVILGIFFLFYFILLK